MQIDEATPGVEIIPTEGNAANKLGGAGSKLEQFHITNNMD
jgi:hypothetical protein